MPELFAVKGIVADHHIFDTRLHQAPLIGVKAILVAVAVTAEVIALGSFIGDNFGQGLNAFNGR